MTAMLPPPSATPPTITSTVLPDHPPVQFIWRRIRHRVSQADGPERIAPEWWAGDADGPSRDYYRVETEPGARFWLFRDAPTDEGGRWWLHGLFA